MKSNLSTTANPEELAVRRADLRIRRRYFPGHRHYYPRKISDLLERLARAANSQKLIIAEMDRLLSGTA